MSKLRIIGTVDQNEKMFQLLDPKDFDDGTFEGHAFYRRSDGKPVIMLVSKYMNPIAWRINDNGSDFFFRSFAEAEEFCKARGYRFVK